MAAVVSHAMRRFPTSPSDTPYSSCRFEGEGASSGALSRSMRYADPWLYGGVASPAGAFLLTPAFALCGCADYAGGTKRSGKKAPTTCKKCKGTRLPVSPQSDSKFGTVRCYPTSVLPASATPTRADTVRVATRPSRPTVLPPPADDPYDLVRRSRLTGGPDHFLAISPLSPGRSTRSSGSKGDNAPSYNATVGRKSILECDINPYELVSPDLSAPHTPSITLVNGQRIRVRSTLHQEHHEYEDVQLRLSTLPVKVNSKPARVAPKRPNSTPSNAAKEAPREDRVNDKKEDTTPKGRTKIQSLQDTSSDYFSNQFKSILKKSSIYDDVEPTDLCQTRSPSPVKRRGSQFYIPMPSSPGSGAKKKVQFLVDNVKIEDNNDANERYSECNSEDDEVFEKPVETKEVPSEPERTEIIKKPPTLYRSLSDRIRKEGAEVNFNDTMALRYPKQRKNLKIDFSDLDRLDGAVHRARKVSPRPKVPPPAPPLPPPKQPEEKSLPPLAEKVDDVADQTPEEKPNELVMMKKLDECINGDITVPIQTDPPSAPPRKRSNNKPPTVNVETPQPAVQRVQIESPDTNRTIVRISSPPAVHKLQIKNDYAESVVLAAASIIENSQRKTSILINGDDCYSTVNVSDSVPLYQSSVVVKDSPPVQKKCSSVYITLPSPELVELDPPELLMQLLKDPVEAVRRNLVPHVCGKADVSRRPRDKKTVKLLPDCKEDPPALLEDDLSSEHSSSTQYEFMDGGSESYSNRSSITEEELANRTKFYELLSESVAVEVTEGEDHLYESIKINNDPIYEEIEIPPPLPSNPPPTSVVDDLNLDKEFTTRSIFEGASKYDILSYLVDAKERGIVQEDSTFPTTFSYPFADEGDSGEDTSLTIIDEKAICQKPAEIERNDSGVGSETSKSSLSKYRTSKQEQEEELCFSCCEDCEAPLEGETMLCRKCCKKRSERKEIITEIVETEEKYGRDLQIILEEFYQPMLVAGLLTPEQLSAIFLNVEELLENSQALAEKLRDAVEIAIEQGDEDLLTVNTGKLFLEAIPMLHAFETYCVRQGAASLLLASLEKDKELLRIFLRVSQMENTMLRRMNLNSFLMVPVQRVTKYPLLLARLHKVTPSHLNNKEELQEAQHKIELHLNHMNSQTRDVPSKLWRRIGSSSGRRASAETDLVNIKLRKIAVDVLEWNHEEARFALEGKLLFTQPTDNNWRRGRTIKLTPVNALLVVNGKPVSNKSTDRTEESRLLFSRHGAREAALLLVRDKNGRYSLLRDPLYLDRCVIAADPAWQSYFEVQEILGRDTFIFKAEDEDQTNIWYKQLQFYAQGMGAWRKRRNALANIMINGMGLRS